MVQLFNPVQVGLSQTYLVNIEAGGVTIRNGPGNTIAFQAATASAALQLLFNFLATLPVGTQAIGGSPPDFTQFTLIFGAGNFYFAAKVTINFPFTAGFAI